MERMKAESLAAWDDVFDPFAMGGHDVHSVKYN